MKNIELFLEKYKKYYSFNEKVANLPELTEENKKYVEELIKLSLNSLDETFAKVISLHLGLENGKYRTFNEVSGILNMPYQKSIDMYQTGFKQIYHVTKAGIYFEIALNGISIKKYLKDRLKEKTKREEKEAKRIQKIKNNLSKADPNEVPIEYLDFSTRIINGFKRKGYNTLADIKDLTDEQLASIPNLGNNSIAIIREKLDSIYQDETAVSIE